MSSLEYHLTDPSAELHVKRYYKQVTLPTRLTQETLRSQHASRMSNARFLLTSCAFIKPPVVSCAAGLNILFMT